MRLPRWNGPGRYLLLSAALFVLLLNHVWSDSWRGDFWIYVATINELADRPLHPRNPLLGNDYPFAFLSPYLWVLGMVARVTRLPAFHVFVLQGLVNLVLLLTALYAFVTAWLRRASAAFYALLFILFLWGHDPWTFSSFFHLRSLVFVVPYPSTFAAILALGGLALLRWRGLPADWRFAAVALPLASVLWIIHPVNGLFFWAGVGAVSLESPRPWRQWIVLASVFAGSIGLALAWPLFPVGDLWFHQTELVHAGNDAMYNEPIPRIAPALVGLPWLLVRLRRNHRDPLALLGLVLAVAVVYGGLSGQWSFGRFISHLVLVLHVAVADATAALEDLLSRMPRTFGLRHLLAPLAALMLIGGAWPQAVVPTLQECWRGDPRWLAFLETRVGRDDVVLTDLDTCWYIPSFRGRVVAYPMQLPFVPDQAERVRAVERFFEIDVPREERQAIIDRYHVKYVLLAKARYDDWQPRLDELRPLGSAVFMGPEHELLRVR
jgi:hypothetical protein